jgi:vacuolar-type H+-ATPase subunit I/STV1
LETLINTSKVMPVTGSLMVDRQKIIELVDQLRLEIPQEVRAAEEVLSQKDQIMNSAMLEARRARSRAEEEFRERFSQNELHRKAEENLRDAEQRAARIIEQAETQAKLRHTEADAYALSSLRSLERELNSISGSVRKGIDMLAGNALVNSANPPAGLPGFGNAPSED